MAILAEHEAGPNYDQVSTSADTESEGILKFVKRTLSSYKQARQRFDRTWQQNYEFVFGGKQWTIDRPAWRFSESVNYTWANIMTEVGIQSDTRPKVEFQPNEPSDFEFAQVLNKINDLNWKKYPWIQRNQDMLTLCKWVHVAHAEIAWNPELEDGLGDVEYRILDPFYCYWDPTATDIDECRCFIYAAPVSTAKLKKLYPDKADSIKSDVAQAGVESWSDIVSTASDRLQLSAQSNVRQYKSPDRYGSEPMTMLIRAWIKDEAVENYEEEREDGSKEYIQKLKYPKGRYVEIACNMVLLDGPNGVRIGEKIVPYADGKIPIARLVNYSLPLEYAGVTEVDHLRGPQKVINYTWSHILDQMKQAGAPKVVIGASSGIDPDNISNEPGQKIIANDVSQVRFEPGVGIANGMQFVMDQAKAAFDTVSGMTDVMKGAVDPAVGSGILFESYAEAAQVRPRLKNRNFDAYMQRIGQLMLSRYLQFYTAPRVYRVSEQPWPEFVEFFVTEDGQGGRQASVTSLAPGRAPEGKTVPVKGTPDVSVSSGSALPFAKALKGKTALEYFSAGVIDQQEVLNAIDWPNKEQVLERMKQAAMAAAPPPGMAP